MRPHRPAMSSWATLESVPRCISTRGSSEFRNARRLRITGGSFFPREVATLGQVPPPKLCPVWRRSSEIMASKFEERRLWNLLLRLARKVPGSPMRNITFSGLRAEVPSKPLTRTRVSAAACRRSAGYKVRRCAFLPKMPAARPPTFRFVSDKSQARTSASTLELSRATRRRGHRLRRGR